jgi:type I restriction enzyme M protein
MLARVTPSEANFKGLFGDIDVNSNKLDGAVAKRNEPTCQTPKRRW